MPDAFPLPPLAGPPAASAPLGPPAIFGETGPPASARQAGLLAASLQARAGAAGPLCLVAAQLASRHLRFDSADPLWPDRDRITLDPALAPLAAALSSLAGIPGGCGVHGPAVGCGVGLALAERLLAARFGRSLVDHRSWVLCPGATLATGPVQEAAWLAGAWRLGRLTVVADAPGDHPPGAAGFAASGWAVRRVRAGDAAAIEAAFSACLRSLKPTLILCTGSATPGAADLRTTDRGRAGDEAASDSAPSYRPSIDAAAREEMPGDAATGDAESGDTATGDANAAWDAVGRRLAGIRRGWLKRLARHSSRAEFEMAIAGRLRGSWHVPLSEPGPLLTAMQTRISTVDTLQHAIAALPAALPELAVLPGVAGWPVPPAQTEPPAAARASSGHLPSGAGAALCGVALHGGVVPLAAFPLDALDALLPALRAAALAGTRLVQILVEPASPPPDDCAALHAIANLQTFRPADASEALECLELAIRHADGPSVLLLCHAPRPLLAERPARTHCARGGYVVAEALGQRAVTLIASGAEIDLVLQARQLLLRRGIRTAVVSLPCWALFARQEARWRESVLGGALRVGVGPGGFGWERWLGPDGLFVALSGTGRNVGGGPGAARPDDTEQITRRLADEVARHLSNAAAS